MLDDKQVAALHDKTMTLLNGRGVQGSAAWAEAVLTALCVSQLPLDAEHASLILALVEQESGFDPHGRLPHPPEAFRKLGYRLIHDLLAGESSEMERQMGQQTAARVILSVTKALDQLGLLREAPLRALFDRTYQRFGWQRVTTEWAIENIVTHDLLTLASETSPLGLVLRAALAAAPGWRQRLVDGAVLQTVGPLQVGVAAAVRLAAADGLGHRRVAGPRASLHAGSRGVLRRQANGAVHPGLYAAEVH